MSTDLDDGYFDADGRLLLCTNCDCTPAYCKCETPGFPAAIRNGRAPSGERLAWAHIIDWDEAFGAKPLQVQWLIEPLLERGTLNAWFGKPAAWKSLIALEASAGLASGRAVLGSPGAGPVPILY